MSPHIVLLGDSIFDNKAYTRGAPDVVGHLRGLLRSGWQASLRAVDGSTTADLPAQLARVPPDASHLVVSIGGNDAIRNIDLLSVTVRSGKEALELFGERVGQFELAYRSAVERVLSLNKETILCTIYSGNLAPEEASYSRVFLMMFNDVILRTAFERNLAAIDLRFVCTEPSDYANPIEPSGTGGRKIADTIAQACGALGRRSGTSVYVG